MSDTGYSPAARQALFAAIDAGRASADFCKMVATSPEAYKATDLLGLNRLLRKVERRAHQLPRAVDTSKAMTATRELSRSLHDLEEYVNDPRLRRACAGSLSWPDGIRSGNGESVFAEVREVNKLLLEYRQNADRGLALYRDGADDLP